MIIEQIKTTLAYRCPACGGVPTSIVGAFSLSGDRFVLKCTCKESHLTVDKQADGKLMLTVPCVSCPQPHNYILSREVFFNKEVFIIPCSTCGIDICFLGDSDKVTEAINASNDEIVKMLGDYAIQQLKTEDSENELVDPQIAEIIRFVIVDLHEDGKIHCGCENDDGDYQVDILEDYVAVKCTKCNRSALIRISGIGSAQDFLNINELNLK